MFYLLSKYMKINKNNTATRAQQTHNKKVIVENINHDIKLCCEAVVFAKLYYSVK